MLVIGFGASGNMSTKRLGSASLHRGHDLELREFQLPFICPPIRWAMGVKNIGDHFLVSAGCFGDSTRDVVKAEDGVLLNLNTNKTLALVEEV